MNVTIDGKPGRGRAGQTILDVCREANIYIPTLCYHPRLSVVGACRMCLVEVEGTGKLLASCSTPAVDGMVIFTDTPKLREHRRLNLELLFSERNHICPFCESSENCELQALGYKHRMESVRVEYLAPQLEMDLTSPFFGLDHNRCILCTRCIRVCDEFEGVHTLDLQGRGSKTVIGVDLHDEFAGSSCTHCGACVQVCPTGALFDKLPAYRGRPDALETKTTTCPGCGVGCGLVAQTRDAQVVHVLGDESCEINRGHTCRIGRYESVEIERNRIQQPRLGNETEKNTTAEIGWDAALKAAADEVKRERTGKTVVALSSRTTLEACVEAERLLVALGEDAVATVLDLNLPPDPKPISSFDILDEADVIWVVDCDPARSAPVLGSMIRRRLRRREAEVVVCSTRKTEIDRHATLKLTLKPDPVATLLIERTEAAVDEAIPDITARHRRRLLACLQEGNRHVVVTSDRPDRRGRLHLFPKERLTDAGRRDVDILNITVGANTLGLAALLGDRLVNRTALADEEIGTIIGVPGDLTTDDCLAALASLSRRAASTIVLACYEMEEVPTARVTLPVATWWEEGPAHVVSLTGTVSAVSPVLPRRGEAPPAAEALRRLTQAVDPSRKATPVEFALIQARLDGCWAEGKNAK